MNKFMSKSGTEINLGECSDLLEQSVINSSIDIGSAVVHSATHPHHGEIMLVNTICGRCAVFA